MGQPSFRSEALSLLHQEVIYNLKPTQAAVAYRLYITAEQIHSVIVAINRSNSNHG